MSDSCHSCSMTIESGHLCQYCSDENGSLVRFSVAFPRFVQWTVKHEPGVSEADAERKTLEFMQTMPAWKEHPDLLSAIQARGGD